MLLMIILYLLWRNRCRCGRGSRASDEYDMEYWLQHVDRQKLAQKNQQHYVFNNPKLPEQSTDPKQATAAWILEHRQIWAHMKRSKNNAFLINQRNNEFVGLENMMTISFNNFNENRKNLTSQQTNQAIVGRILTKFKSRKGFFAFKQNEESRKTHLLYEGLDAKAQLLINYPRFEATSANVKSKTLNGQHHDEISLTHSKSIHEQENTALCDQANSTQTMQMFLINMFLLNRKRRHSWPRCKLDYVQFQNYSKDIRMYYFKNKPKLVDYEQNNLEV